MNRVVSVMGEVNRKGKFEVTSDIRISDVLNECANGMKDKRKVKLIQIGGPLGLCITTTALNTRLSDYDEFVSGNQIMFLSSLLCPVDYLRFLTRYVIRELRIDNDHIRKLNQTIEKIAQGTATVNDFESLTDEIDKEVASESLSRLNQIFKYIISEFRNEFMEHIVHKRCENGICRSLIVAQCMNACPAEVYVPGYIELMRNDKVDKAYRLMRKENPLSFVCGMVCTRPCEARCRRGEIESTVGVRALKRYASEMTLKLGGFVEEKSDSNGKKVGIVGSGPAGLTAAYYLARSGYDVVIYEASNVIGGMLAMGIPEYRLPQDTIDKEVELIKTLGVKIITNVKVGEDISIEELEDKFDAVLLATGCHIGNKFGPELDTVETAIDFLRNVKVDNRKEIGDTVLVIGGGDVAMDAARTSIRLGAKKVMVASLESYEKMPASDEEKVEATEEGIQFISSYGTKDIHVKDGRLTGIDLKKCMSLMDDLGQFNPSYDEQDVKTIEIDNLILAIGQRADISYLNDATQGSKKSLLEIDQYTFETKFEGIFAAGDIRHQGIAIEAIAEGKKAAESIDRYLGGIGLYLGQEIEVPDRPLESTLWSIEKVVESQKVSEERKESFDTVSRVYLDVDAKNEAARCMRCDRNSRKPLYLK